MFIGHYAVALAVKRVAPRTSLGTLFAAASLADLLWPVFLLFGWEQAHVVPGPNPFLTLWLDSIPISHSLITLIGWGALFAYLYRVRTGDGRAALVVAHVGSLSSPPPPTRVALAVGGIIFGWLFVGWAAWGDRHRGGYRVTG